MAKRNLSKIKAHVNAYVEELKKNGVIPTKVILFGSYAKGTARAYSDVDIVVVSKNLKVWPPIERLQMLSRATANIDVPLEVLGYTPEEIRQHGRESVFWDEIMRTGIEIYKKAA